MTVASPATLPERGTIPVAPPWFRDPLLAIAILVTLPFYVATTNPTIGFVDRGEMAATTVTFGIPHPTGYPTFTLLGGAVAHLLPFRPVHTLDVLAAVLVALGAALLVLLFARVLALAAPDSPPSRRRRAALLAGLFTAFTATWWQEANGWEVYALHAVMLPLVILCFLRWVELAAGERVAPRAAFAFAVVLGLSFTNHMTTVLLAPGLLAYAFARLGRRGVVRALPVLALGFVLGLLPYAWLPLRSAMHPRFDWHATRTLHGFIDHLTAREYRGWMFDRVGALADQPRYLAWRMPWDLVWIGVVAAAAGLAWLIRRHPALALMLMLMLLAGYVFPVTYRIREIDPYLMTAVLAMGAGVAACLLWIDARAGSRVALVVGAALVVLDVAVHCAACDEHRNRLVEDLVRQQLGPLPRNAVLFTTQWDYGLAASYYFQEVERFRRDVLVVSPDLLRRGWYVDELERRAPLLLTRAASDARRFRAAVEPYERHRPYDARALGDAYSVWLDGLARAAMVDRPVYVTLECSDRFRPEWARVPEGLALRLKPDRAAVPGFAPPSTYRPWSGHMDGYVATTSWIYGQAWAARAAWEAQHGRPGAANAAFDHAAAFDPHIDLASVPPLPLDERAFVIQAADFFRQVRSEIAARSHRP